MKVTVFVTVAASASHVRMTTMYYIVTSLITVISLLLLFTTM